MDPNTRSDTSHSWSGIEPANKNCNVNKIWISTIACGSSRVVVILGTKEVLGKPESCFLLEKTIKSIQRLLSQFYAFSVCMVNKVREESLVVSIIRQDCFAPQTRCFETPIMDNNL